MPSCPGAAVGFLVAGLSLPAMTIGGLVGRLRRRPRSPAWSRALHRAAEDASLAAFYLISLALGVMHRLAQGLERRPAARAVRHACWRSTTPRSPDRVDRHAHAGRARADLSAAGARMPRSRLPALGQPRRGADASRLSRPRRAQSRRRLPGARHASRRRHHDAARGGGPLLVRRHHARCSSSAAAIGIALGRRRPAAVASTRAPTGPGHHPGRRRTLSSLRSCSARRAGCCWRLLPGRHLEA